MSIRRVALAGLVTVVVSLLAAASAAAATGGLEFLSSFNRPGAGFGDVAVNQSNGDVYVVDSGAVDVFNSASVFQSAFAVGANDVAVDEATGQIFVTNHVPGSSESSDVEVFSASGVYETTWTGSNTPSDQEGLGGRGEDFVAVDNSKSPSDPSAGDVYVAIQSSTRSGGSEGLVDKFNAKGEYLSQFSGVERPESYFNWLELGGITVDSSGGVYVFEKGFGMTGQGEGSPVVDEFSPEGKYMRRVTGMPQMRGFAVNGGDIYAVAGSNVYLFDSSGALEGELLGAPSGPFSEPLAMAFNEAAGDSYVPDGGSEAVDVFGPASMPPAPSTDPPSAVTGTSLVMHGDLNPGGVSTKYFFSYKQGASCEGNTTALSSAGSGGGDVNEEASLTGLEPDAEYTYCVYAVVGDMASAGAPVTVTTTALAPTIEATSVSSNVVATTVEAKVNPNKQVTTCEIEYGTTESYGTSVPCEGDFGALYAAQQATVNLYGLTSGTVYYYRVVARNATGTTYSPSGQSFTSPGPVPVTGAASAVGQASANVTGTVNPEGLESYYYYQYGPTTEYGQGTAPSGPGISVAPGTSAVAAPASLIPLVPGITYHYRLVAWNAEGTSYGEDRTFTTPAGLSPVAATGPASGISVDEATISGTVEPVGKETNYRFEYGTTTAYGTQAFGVVLPEQALQTVTLNLRGIEANTTYHYRLVVSNAGGTSYGEDRTFTTAPIAFPLIAPTPPALLALPAVSFPAEEGSGIHPEKGKKKSKSKSKKRGAKKRKRSKKTHKRGDA
jgi:hypothetical protein